MVVRAAGAPGAVSDRFARGRRRRSRRGSRERTAGFPRWRSPAESPSRSRMGSADSVLFEDGSPTPVPLQGTVDGRRSRRLALRRRQPGADDAGAPDPDPTATVPERRDPAHLRVRPRGRGRRGSRLHPRPASRVTPCVSDIDGRPARSPSGRTPPTARAPSTTAQVDTLVFGANLGVAFPAQVREAPAPDQALRRAGSTTRSTPKGLVVDAALRSRRLRCTDRLHGQAAFQPIIRASCARRPSRAAPPRCSTESARASTSRWMWAATVRSVSRCSWARAPTACWAIGRSTSAPRKSFDDQIGMDVAVADFEVEVDPWMYRAHVGIRFQWLGSPE